MILLLACSILILAPPESDTVSTCVSAVSCAPTGPDQVARFYLRAEALDQAGNVSELSELAAEVRFDIADLVCWRRLLAGLVCSPAPPN